jgi:hypothetical protein
MHWVLILSINQVKRVQSNSWLIADLVVLCADNAKGCLEKHLITTRLPPALKMRMQQTHKSAAKKHAALAQN